MNLLETLFIPNMREKLARGVQADNPELHIKFSHGVIDLYLHHGGQIPNLYETARKITSIDQLKNKSGEWRFVVAEGVFGAPQDAFRCFEVGRIPSIGREGKIISEIRFRTFDPKPKTPPPEPIPHKILCLR